LKTVRWFRRETGTDNDNGTCRLVFVFFKTIGTNVPRGTGHPENVSNKTDFERWGENDAKNRPVGGDVVVVARRHVSARLKSRLDRPSEDELIHATRRPGHVIDRSRK